MASNSNVCEDDKVKNSNDEKTTKSSSPGDEKQRKSEVLNSDLHVLKEDSSAGEKAYDIVSGFNEDALKELLDELTQPNSSNKTIGPNKTHQIAQLLLDREQQQIREESGCSSDDSPECGKQSHGRRQKHINNSIKKPILPPGTRSYTRGASTPSAGALNSAGSCSRLQELNKDSSRGSKPSNKGNPHQTTTNNQTKAKSEQQSKASTRTRTGGSCGNLSRSSFDTQPPGVHRRNRRGREGGKSSTASGSTREGGSLQNLSKAEASVTQSEQKSLQKSGSLSHVFDEEDIRSKHKNRRRKHSECHSRASEEKASLSEVGVPENVTTSSSDDSDQEYHSPSYQRLLPADDGEVMQCAVVQDMRQNAHYTSMSAHYTSMSAVSAHQTLGSTHSYHPEEMTELMEVVTHTAHSDNDKQPVPKKSEVDGHIGFFSPDTLYGATGQTATRREDSSASLLRSKSIDSDVSTNIEEKSEREKLKTQKSFPLELGRIKDRSCNSLLVKPVPDMPHILQNATNFTDAFKMGMPLLTSLDNSTPPISKKLQQLKDIKAKRKAKEDKSNSYEKDENYIGNQELNEILKYIGEDQNDENNTNGKKKKKLARNNERKKSLKDDDGVNSEHNCDNSVSKKKSNGIKKTEGEGMREASSVEDLVSKSKMTEQINSKRKTVDDGEVSKKRQNKNRRNNNSDSKNRKTIEASSNKSETSNNKKETSNSKIETTSCSRKETDSKSEVASLTRKEIASNSEAKMEDTSFIKSEDSSFSKMNSFNKDDMVSSRKGVKVGSNLKKNRLSSSNSELNKCSASEFGIEFYKIGDPFLSPSKETGSSPVYSQEFELVTRKKSKKKQPNNAIQSRGFSRARYNEESFPREGFRERNHSKFLSSNKLSNSVEKSPEEPTASVSTKKTSAINFDEAPRTPHDGEFMARLSSNTAVNNETTTSAPNSDCYDSDGEGSVKSMPTQTTSKRQKNKKQTASSDNNTPQASYANITKMASFANKKQVKKISQQEAYYHAVTPNSAAAYSTSEQNLVVNGEQTNSQVTGKSPSSVKESAKKAHEGSKPKHQKTRSIPNNFLNDNFPPLVNEQKYISLDKDLSCPSTIEPSVKNIMNKSQEVNKSDIEEGLVEIEQKPKMESKSAQTLYDDVSCNLMNGHSTTLASDNSADSSISSDKTVQQDSGFIDMSAKSLNTSDSKSEDSIKMKSKSPNTSDTKSDESTKMKSKSPNISDSKSDDSTKTKIKLPNVSDSKSDDSTKTKSKSPNISDSKSDDSTKTKSKSPNTSDSKIDDSSKMKSKTPNKPKDTKKKKLSQQNVPVVFVNQSLPPQSNDISFMCPSFFDEKEEVSELHLNYRPPPTDTPDWRYQECLRTIIARWMTVEVQLKTEPQSVMVFHPAM